MNWNRNSPFAPALLSVPPVYYLSPSARFQVQFRHWRLHWARAFASVSVFAKWEANLEPAAHHVHLCSSFFFLWISFFFLPLGIRVGCNKKRIWGSAGQDFAFFEGHSGDKRSYKCAQKTRKLTDTVASSAWIRSSITDWYRVDHLHPRGNSIQCIPPAS